MNQHYRHYCTVPSRYIQYVPGKEGLPTNWHRFQTTASLSPPTTIHIPPSLPLLPYPTLLTTSKYIPPSLFLPSPAIYLPLSFSDISGLSSSYSCWPTFLFLKNSQKEQRKSFLFQPRLSIISLSLQVLTLSDVAILALLLSCESPSTPPSLD